MKKRLKGILASTVEESLESLAFLIPEQIETENWESYEPGSLQASILLHEPYLLQFRLMISERLAEDIARTAYSLEDRETNRSILADTVKELLNIIAGQTVKYITPPGIAFKLGLPETGPAALMEYGSEQIMCTFKVGESFLSVAVIGDHLKEIGSDAYHGV